MPTPVVELIMDEVVRRLEQITIANGYSFDVASVVRPSRFEDKAFSTNSIVINEPSLDPVPELSHEGNPPATCWRLNVELNGILRESDDTTSPRTEAQYNFAAEIIAAITGEATTPATWHQWEGNAINTEWGQITDFQSDDGMGNGFTFALGILFRTDEDDPFVARS